MVARLAGTSRNSRCATKSPAQTMAARAYRSGARGPTVRTLAVVAPRRARGATTAQVHPALALWSRSGVAAWLRVRLTAWPRRGVSGNRARQRVAAARRSAFAQNWSRQHLVACSAMPRAWSRARAATRSPARWTACLRAGRSGGSARSLATVGCSTARATPGDNQRTAVRPVQRQPSSAHATPLGARRTARLVRGAAGASARSTAGVASRCASAQPSHRSSTAVPGARHCTNSVSATPRSASARTSVVTLRLTRRQAASAFSWSMTKTNSWVASTCAVSTMMSRRANADVSTQPDHTKVRSQTATSMPSTMRL